MSQKNVWYCTQCGQKVLKWAGQCPGCNTWNSLQEEVELKAPSRYFSNHTEKAKPVRLHEIQKKDISRIKTNIFEFDRLIGGGVVPGSLTLIGGEPGIGKSTLTLQLSSAFAKEGHCVLYISGEESVEQTSMRADRLGIEDERVFLFGETNFNKIEAEIDIIKPSILIIDSIQIIYKSELSSAPGSVSQVRETTCSLMHLAKGKNIATFIIGHVTKAGEIAGPRVLEHLVDTVLYFEGDKHYNYRMIRVVKNRFGPTDEIALFQMHVNGLKEIPNPSLIFIEERMKNLIGSVIAPTLEGSRPILIETQALVTQTVFPAPSRRSTGIDANRLQLLLAVLEKRMGYQLHRMDVFVSIAGGIRVAETGIDLAVLIAVASSLQNMRIDPDTTVVGEVGLGGEVRSIPRIEHRINEADRMGFKQCIIPNRNLKGLDQKRLSGMKIFGVDVVEEAINHLLH